MESFCLLASDLAFQERTNGAGSVEDRADLPARTAVPALAACSALNCPFRPCLSTEERLAQKMDLGMDFRGKEGRF